MHNYNIEGALSIVGADEPEDFQPMVHEVVGLDLSTAEVMLMGHRVRNSKTTQRFTMKRANTSVNYAINKYTGAIE